MNPTRRSTLLAAAGLGLLPGPVRAAGPLEPTLLIRTTGGAFEAALKRNFFDPFSKASGVRVVPFAASYGDMMAKSAAMQAAGAVEWDIISPQYDELTQISQYLTDLGDCAAMPNVARDGVAGTCGRYGVLYLTGAQPLTWNTGIIKGPAPQILGRLLRHQTLPRPPRPAQHRQPLGHPRHGPARRRRPPREAVSARPRPPPSASSDTIKNDVAVWWKTGDQSVKMWTQDDIAMSLMFGGTAYAAKRRGEPIAYTYNQAIADFGAWAILKGAPHPNAARAFIDFYMTDPEAHARFAHEMGYTTSNAAAGPLLVPEDREDLLSTPQKLASVVRIDYDWLAAHRSAVINRFQAWVSS